MHRCWRWAQHMSIGRDNTSRRSYLSRHAAASENSCHTCVQVMKQSAVWKAVSISSINCHPALAPRGQLQ